jgi:DNA-binding GntR family transcriptional regulator
MGSKGVLPLIKPKAKRGSEGKVTPLSTQLAMRLIDLIRGWKLPVGSHLTERGLADALRVSRTPTRGALHFLEKMDVVDRAHPRGFVLKKPADELPEISVQRQDDDLYLRIAEDRLEARLPSRITSSELMRRYGCSQARLLPVLSRMTHEGWLDRLPGKGWEFQPMMDSPEAYDQSYRFRMLIEPAALAEPGYKIDPDAFARIRTQQEEMLAGKLLQYSRPEVFEIGASFHETIVGCSGNPYILDALRRINQLRRLIEYRGNTDRGRLVSQCKEHIQLLDMIESGDRDGASEFLRRHLDVARKIKAGRPAAS